MRVALPAREGQCRLGIDYLSLSRRTKPFRSHADRGAPTGAFALRTKSGVGRHSGVRGRCDRARSGITARQIGLWGVPFPPPSLVNVLIEWWRGVIRLAVFTRGSARTSKKKPPAARGVLSRKKKFLRCTESFLFVFCVVVFLLFLLFTAF